jgi:hypothetical protein
LKFGVVVEKVHQCVVVLVMVEILVLEEVTQSKLSPYPQEQFTPFKLAKVDVEMNVGITPTLVVVLAKDLMSQEQD